MRVSKTIDVLLLILFPVLAVVLSLALKANLLTSTFLFFGPPSLWLSIRTRSKIKKALLFAFFLSLPLGIMIDYIAVVGGSWFIPITSFPFRIFGIVAMDNLIWGFLFIYCIVIFYEHFLDKGRDVLISKRVKYLMWPVAAALLIFLIVIFTRPEILVIKYSYLWMGILLVLLPTVSFLSFFPKLISRYLKAASYFFLLSLLFEFTALQLNQWAFPGKYFIGWVELLGYRFPFEELFFWMIMGTIAILSYYEFFDDDRK